jgi:hypothetical protein
MSRTPATIDGSERSPLLPSPDGGKRTIFSPIRRVMFVALVSATSFAFTQTSLIYAFRVMTCDEYFESRIGGERSTNMDMDMDSSLGLGYSVMLKDRCSIPIVESRTAQAIAVMSTMTTFCCTLSPDYLPHGYQPWAKGDPHYSVKASLTRSDPKSLRHWLLVQETRNQDRHVSTNILGLAPVPHPDLRFIPRRSVRNQHDYHYPNDQCSGIRRRV